MDPEQRKAAFVQLGLALRSLEGEEQQAFRKDAEPLEKAVQNVASPEGWFTPDNISAALQHLARQLTEEQIDTWLEPYYDRLYRSNDAKNVAVIMAGNIPLVGFHDMLCVLMSGHAFLGKLSSKDDQLLPALAEVLCRIEPGFRSLISFEQAKLPAFDGVIATGSNNSARYFEKYFGPYPHIIRKNRNGVAILDGEEEEAELEVLGKDVFTYFGLGCRNVAKVYVPDTMDPERLMKCWEPYRYLIDHPKYNNNYHYNRATFLMNGSSFKDNGFILLKEDEKIASPLGMVYYEHYRDQERLREELQERRGEEVQCIVSRQDVPFGKAQAPDLWDYADDVDTMAFLLRL